MESNTLRQETKTAFHTATALHQIRLALACLDSSTDESGRYRFVLNCSQNDLVHALHEDGHDPGSSVSSAEELARELKAE